jgi:enamine deaminase RidA (YjgF/YER057c/UK114 family)
MEINYINPQNMAAPRGYSHAISISRQHRTIYIGGQNAIDEKGNLIGKNSLREQTEQVLVNIEKIPEYTGAIKVIKVLLRKRVSAPDCMHKRRCS